MDGVLADFKKGVRGALSVQLNNVDEFNKKT